MPLLIIANEDGSEDLRLTIDRVDPRAATVAIIQALAGLPKPKKTRSDAGKSRAKTEPQLSIT